ncbi:MAG TPA: hypothetical protein PKU97_18280, partial [Kofleriaceae bacterium]|nr:hypothetical protein [Kofleriaceae bacterium]
MAAALATAAACTSAPEHPTSAVQLAVEAADTPLDQARALVTWVCEENAPKRTEGTETRDVPAGTWPDSGVTKITYKMVVMPVLEYRAKPAGSTCTGREARVTRWEVAIVATAYDAQNKMVMAAVHGIPITGGKVERPLALWATVGGETFAVYQGESAERDAWLLKNAQTMVEVINKVSAGPAPAPCGEEDETCEAPPPAVPDEPMPPPVPGEEPLPPMPPLPEEPTPLLGWP